MRPWKRKRHIKLFSCQVENWEEIVAFTKFNFRKPLIWENFGNCFRVQISKSALLNEKVSSSPHDSDISYRYFDFSSEVSSFRLLCGGFRVLWPESVCFSIYSAWGPTPINIIIPQKWLNSWIPEKNIKTPGFVWMMRGSHEIPSRAKCGPRAACSSPLF